MFRTSPLAALGSIPITIPIFPILGFPRHFTPRASTVTSTRDPSVATPPKIGTPSPVGRSTSSRASGSYQSDASSPSFEPVHRTRTLRPSVASGSISSTTPVYPNVARERHLLGNSSFRSSRNLTLIPVSARPPKIGTPPVGIPSARRGLSNFIS